MLTSSKLERKCEQRENALVHRTAYNNDFKNWLVQYHLKRNFERTVHLV